MNIKKSFQNTFRKILTIISPKLNTYVTYMVKFKRKLDLNNPKTFNEKLLWLKFNTYWENSLIKQCADKLKVREYLDSNGYSEILNDLIGYFDKVEDIDFNQLPSKFAVKLNVGCGCNFIVNDKDSVNIGDLKNTMNKWLKSNYWLGWSEMQYKGVKPYILIEKYLGDDSGKLPVDYKFYCMNGEAKYVMVCIDRNGKDHPKFFFMDRTWKKLPFTEEVFKYPDMIIDKPKNIDEAFEIAEKLSKGFPFVRVDLYIVDNKIYFGEFTFTPAAGMDIELKFKPPGFEDDVDLILGSNLTLPIK